MPVTDDQLRAITYLALAARPTGAPRWDEAGLYANLAKVRDRSLGTVVIAAIQAAEDRKAATPGVIPRPGPHWRTPESAPVVERPRFDRAATCSTCSLSEAECRRRWSDDHEFVPITKARLHAVPSPAELRTPPTPAAPGAGGETGV